jgi:hypothetical protein
LRFSELRRRQKTLYIRRKPDKAGDKSMDSDMDRPIKYRNMILQATAEMKALAKDPEASPALWTVLFIIPFAFFYSYYKHGELYEKISDEHMNRWIIFILWIVFRPAVWFIVQMELNKKATVGRPLS